MYLYGIEIVIPQIPSLTCASYNCTFMELKFTDGSLECTDFVCYNCTFMELKFAFRCIAGFGFFGYNCTFMELKSTVLKLGKKQVLVIIVPLWN